MFFLIKSAFWIAVVYTCVVWSGEKSAPPLPVLARDMANIAQTYAVEKGTAACTADIATCLSLAKRAADMTPTENETKPAIAKGGADKAATGVTATVVPPERPRAKGQPAGKAIPAEEMRPASGTFLLKHSAQRKLPE